MKAPRTRFENTSPVDPSGCEFCDEFADPRGSVFSRLYSHLLPDRIVARSGGFVAFPTIGQIFSQYLLVAPEAHVETLAGLPPSQIARLSRFAQQLSRVVARGGPVAIFEHGARKETGGGCGIYHAHLHIVPLPRLVGPDEVLPASAARHSSLAEALSAVRLVREYLMFGSDRDFAVVDLTSRTGEYPSQYFRKALSDLLGHTGSWNWKDVAAPERALLDTVASFRG